MTHDDLLLKLQQLSEGNDEYRQFNARIVNDDTVEYIGVRTPELRKVAKEIAKGGWRKFLNENSWRTHEEKTLACMLPQYIKPKPTLDELFAYFDEIIPHLSSWALTDCMGTKYSQIQENQAKSWTKVVKYIRGEQPWECRLGIILMMANFLNDEYVDQIITEVKSVKTTEYYVKMAIAWLLATAAISYRDKIEQLLPEIDPQTAKMTRQKMRDSYRIK